MEGVGFNSYHSETNSPPYQTSNNNKTSKKDKAIRHQPLAQDEQEEEWIPHERQCTDVFCLWIFILYLAGMLAASVYAVRNGNIYWLFYQTDSFGNICGLDNEHIIIPEKYRKNVWLQNYVGQDMSHRKFSFFLDVTRTNNSLKICVQKCPDENVDPMYVDDFHKRTRNAFCMPDGRDKVHGRFCPRGPIYKSTERLMMCVPNIALSKTTSSHEIGVLFNSIYMLLQCFIQDILIIRYDILPFCAISLGLAVLMAFILQFFSSKLISLLYISITLITAGLVSFCWYFWYAYYSHVRRNPKTKGEHPLNVSCYLLLILLSALTLAMLTMLVMMWCAFPRCRQVKDFFQDAARALRQNISLIILPMSTTLCILAIYVACLIICLFLFSTAPGKIIYKKAPDGLVIPTVEAETTETIRCLWCFLVAGTIWVAEFTYACHRYIVVGTVIKWFQNRRVPCCIAHGNLLRYHVGSLAFGSLAINIFKTPRCIVMWINARLKSCGKCCTSLFICLVVVLDCLERRLRHLHDGAYTIIAYKGYAFCQSAKFATALHMEHALDADRIYSSTVTVIGITKALVAVIVAISAGFWFHYRYKLDTSLLLVFLMAQFAYMIASRFLSVFEIIIETLFVRDILTPPGEECLRSNLDLALCAPQSDVITSSGRRADKELVMQDEYGTHRTPRKDKGSPPPPYTSNDDCDGIV